MLCPRRVGERNCRFLHALGKPFLRKPPAKERAWRACAAFFALHREPCDAAFAFERKRRRRRRVTSCGDCAAKQPHTGRKRRLCAAAGGLLAQGVFLLGASSQQRAQSRLGCSPHFFPRHVTAANKKKKEKEGFYAQHSEAKHWDRSGDCDCASVSARGVVGGGGGSSSEKDGQKEGGSTGNHRHRFGHNQQLLRGVGARRGARARKRGGRPHNALSRRLCAVRSRAAAAAATGERCRRRGGAASGRDERRKHDFCDEAACGTALRGPHCAAHAQRGAVQDCARAQRRRLGRNDRRPPALCKRDRRARSCPNEGFFDFFLPLLSFLFLDHHRSLSLSRKRQTGTWAWAQTRRNGL